MMEQTLYLTSDAWVDEASPGTNHGDAARLRLDGGGSDERRAYIHASLPFASGAKIISATLYLRLSGSWSGSHLLRCQRVNGAKWAENTITWNNKPSTTSTHQATVTPSGGADQDVVSLNVTSMLQDVADGGAWYGMRLTLDDDVDRALYGGEYPDASLHPQLVIQWTEAPDPPDSLVPSGERAVSVDAPILSWHFHDVVGNQQQASSQVQVSADPGDFDVTPDYDSGKVANTYANWDLSADMSFTPFSPDDVFYWRVKVWDNTDEESDWSDVVASVYTELGNVVIVSPTTTVEQTTPPVDWTFDLTQEAYRFSLVEVLSSGATKELYDTGRVTSADTDAADIPKDLIVTGKDYRAVLQVWDDVDRAVTPGAPDYVIETVDFTYVRDGTPDPVETLTATPDGAAVILTWTRTVEPDYFSLVVDGEEVAQRIEPEDVFVVDDEYEYKYWGATPRVASTYEVEAVIVDTTVHKHSSGNATATVATNPIGIWLIDPDDDTHVVIYGSEDAGLSLGESGTTFVLVGSRAPVRITDSIRGYEGTLTGVILDRDARDDFIDLKERLVELRVVVGDLNFPCWLEEIAVVPTPSPGDFAYSCSFSLFQTGEFPTGRTAIVGALGWDPDLDTTDSP